MIILGALRPFAAPLPFNFGDVLVVGIVAFAPPARTTLFFWGRYAGRANVFGPRLTVSSKEEGFPTYPYGPAQKRVIMPSVI